MAQLIGEQEIEEMALGAALLGAGGGGDPYLGKLMAIQAIRKYGPVTLLDPQEVPDQAFIIPCASMGATTIMIEKIPNGTEALATVRLLENEFSRKATATMPVECGGINSTLPFVVAAEAGIPVIDADGMGRAFPEIPMTVFHVNGLPASPLSIIDEQGNYGIIKCSDNLMAENVARALTVQMGGISHFAEFVMSGAQMKKIAIHNTVSLCIKIGKKIQNANNMKQDPIEAIRCATRGSSHGEAIILFMGAITDVRRRGTDAFVRGRALVDGFASFKGKQLEVDFQNENLIARINSRIIATVPDLITFVDTETGNPVPIEALKYGQRVTCIGIPTPAVMRRPEALEIWGPRYFGYGCDFIPIEEIHAERTTSNCLLGST